MADESKEQFFARLETLGEAEARSMLQTNRWGGRHKPWVIEWLFAKDLARAEQAEDRAEAAVAAAKASAAASIASAESAERSSFWARVSAIATAALVVVGVVTLLVSKGG